MMWADHFAGPPGHIPFGQRMSKSAPCSPVKPVVKRPPARADSFHVVHKVPMGDTPYVKAKHVQLVDKDPDRAIALFWAAINAGDRVDSALKDMAIVMKQQNRPQEAIEAIKSLRNRCSDQAQESLDNVLLDLYKRCGRLDDQIALLKHKLHLIHQGMAFNGKRTKTARSQGKKFQVSIEQEATRLLGNLGWAYMQQSNFVAAEAVYRKALSIEPDNNKVCNLGICLMKQGRLDEAKAMLQSVTPACNDNRWASDSHLKSYERAQEMLLELETSMGAQGTDQNAVPKFSAFAIPGCDTGSYDLQHSSLWQPQPALPRQPRRMARSSLEQQFSQYADNSMTGALLATAGFGPSKSNSNTQPSGNGLNSCSLVGSQQGSKQQQQQQCEPLSQGHSWLQAANTDLWDGDDSDYSSPDENSDANVQCSQQDAGQQLYCKADFQQMQWHAESLRQRLESVSVLGMGSRSGCASVAVQSRAWDSCGEELAQVRTTSPPCSEQPLSSEATPFNPVVLPGEQQPPVPNQGSVHSNENAPPNTSAGENRAFDSERVPLTFDLTNGPRSNNGVNNNVLEERRVVKQLGVANGWNNNNNKDNNINNTSKSFKSTTASGYGNGWSRGGDYNENRPTSRRSLSMGSNENPLTDQTFVVLHPAQQNQQNQHLNSGGLPPLHNAAGKRSRTLTPVKEKTVSAWGSLGFTHSPSDLDFGCCEDAQQQIPMAIPKASFPHLEALRSSFAKEAAAASSCNASADLSASEMELKRQRRLRVFQEMTLTGSPQA